MKLNTFLKKNKLLILIVSAIALFISMCHAGKCQKQMEAFKGKKGMTCLLVYSNNCTWCKKMMPEWKKFKKTCKNKNIKIKDVEAKKNPELVKNLGIKGFPTILMLKDGKPISTYKGERTSKGFHNFVSKHN